MKGTTTMNTITRQVRCIKNWGCCTVGTVCTLQWDETFNKHQTVRWHGLPFCTAVPNLTVSRIERGECHRNFEFID